MQNPLPHSAIAILSRPSGVSKRVQLGAASFLRKVGNFSILPYDLDDPPEIHEITDVCVGAILVRNDSTDDSFVTDIKDRLPSIVVGSDLSQHSVASLNVEDEEIAGIAAQTFLDRGFSKFAYAGAMAHVESRHRYEFFSKILDKSRYTPFVFSSNYELGSKQSIDSGEEGPTRMRLFEWVRNLPKPIGVFASDDTMAFEIYQAANRIGVDIPKEMALLGVNDDGFLCKITNPNLSSIRLPFERMGWDAAQILHGIISKDDKVKQDKLVYQPIGLIARGSIKSIVVEDKIVRDALIFIQENYMKPVNVEDILSELDVSRSLLERRFRDEIGVTPLVELRRQRIEKARALLSDTNEPIHDMGKKCGFSSAIRFTTVFKEQVGMTPSEFRKKMYPIAHS